tara:strand:+ start:467 stop:1882 length:1416 start_codon:yes stop_codon:yes gene_type:complete
LAKFQFYLETPDEREVELHYDNETSSLTYGKNTCGFDEGARVIPAEEDRKISRDRQPLLKEDGWQPFFKMNHGKRDLKRIKIQLGMKCNYSCEYCSQRFVPRNPDDSYTNQETEESEDQIRAFISRFDDLDTNDRLHFELWGGEPFLYFEKMKLITKLLHDKYPKATYSVITNGSLINDEIIEFLKKYDFDIGVSHDGPGQPTRGPDPMDDPEKAKWLTKLMEEFLPKGKISANPIMHEKNPSRAAVQEYMIEKFGEHIRLGEGAIVDIYDEEAKQMALKSEEAHIDYRRKAFNELMNHKADAFGLIKQKLDTFSNSVKDNKPSSSLTQKCGMDDPTIVSLDLNGQQTTCQNVSASSSNPANIPHLIGEMEDLDTSTINAGTHWSDRPECVGCPVLQLCHGACLFLSPGSDEWGATCENSYSDNVVWLALALYDLTGNFLYRIEGDIPEFRKDVFGFETERFIPKEPSAIA